MMISGIYGLQCNTTGKWYVGYSKNIHNRWSRYERLRCDKQPVLYNHLKKYGWNNFTTHVLEKCSDLEQLPILEREWIAKTNCIYPNGLNLTSGGDGVSDPSQESRRKMSVAKMGKKVGKRPVEWTANIRRARRAQGITPANRVAIRRGWERKWKTRCLNRMVGWRSFLMV